MKRKISRFLPQIIIIVVIAAVGASIILGQLKAGSSKTASQSASARSAAQAAGPAGEPGGIPGDMPAGPGGDAAAPAAGGGGAFSGSQSGAAGQTLRRAAGAAGNASGSTAGAAIRSTGNAAGARTTGASAPSSAAASSSARTGAASGAGSRAAASSARTISVRTAKIETASLNTYTKIHGDVISATEVKVYPSVAGKLLERKVAVGERVQEGTVLATVDPSKVGQNYLPNPVESPLAGTVLSITVNPGDTISANTVIATVGDLSRLKISTAVSERYVGNLKIGTSAEISFDAFPDLVFPAKVSELSPVIDPSSRTRDVKLSLSKTDPRILPGMFATIKLVIESRNNVLVVPRTAVTLSSAGAYVFVVKEKSEGVYVAQRRDIELGLEGEEFFEAKSGLAAGESVVTEGRAVVTDGDTLRVVGGLDGATL